MGKFITFPFLYFTQQYRDHETSFFILSDLAITGPKKNETRNDRALGTGS